MRLIWLVRAAAVAAVAATWACSNAADGTDVSGAELPLETRELSLQFGPVVVPPGVEKTQCVTVRLGNAGPFRVGSIENVLSGASHHLVVYRSDDEEERTEPYDCEPFADTLNPRSGTPLMITQKHEERLELPQGLAFVLDPQQMIRLEVHYLNSGSEPATITSRSRFQPLAGAFEHAVGFLFAGTLDVALPPARTTTVEAFIEPPLQLNEKQFFGFTGHTHARGIDVNVEMGERRGATQAVYRVDDFNWSEPATVHHWPALTLPEDGRFHIRCEYRNDSDAYVGFGASARDEMCFFWGYYFPSAGSFVCFQSGRSGVAINSCCPGGLFCG